MEKKKPHDSVKCENGGESLELIVEELTHSGQKTLDPGKLKKLKNICKKSDKNVGHVYDLIIHQLEKNHSEIRFSAFQLCDELFRRSHYFRQLVVDKLHHVLELTAETNPDLPLPLPRAVALNLKKLSLVTVRDWCNKYGHAYKKLVLGFNYLQQCKKVDFNALQLQSDAERARDEEKERRLRAINEERVKKVKKELNEFNLDITGTVKSLNNCLDLLLPKPEEFFISLKDEENCKDGGISDVLEASSCSKPQDRLSEEMVKKDSCNQNDDDEECDSEDENYDESGRYNLTLREFGALNTKHVVEINLKLDEVNSLKETSENSVVIENVRDHVKLITNSYLPRVKGWLQILTKSSGNLDVMKTIMDLKLSMENALEKYNRLNIKSVMEDDCVSTDSEMEEVVETNNIKIGNSNGSDIKKTKKVKKIEDQSMWSILSKDECPEDPTTMHSTLAKYSKRSEQSKLKTPSEGCSEVLVSKEIEDPKPSTSKELDCSSPSTSKEILPKNQSVLKQVDDSFPSSSKSAINEEVNERKKKLLAVAPKLPYGDDLYHWEDDDLKAPTLLPTSMGVNKLWSSVSGDDIMEVTVPEGLSHLRTRVIEFVGEFKPVSRSCRAPLSNGKLCPRKDRYKCPFHGVIVPRDEMGKCINLSDELRIKAAEEEKKVPDWQDPELLKDIEKATGIDLKMPVKGKRKKKEKQYPGLTDINAKQNTAKNRLSKLVFKRSAMKRVARALDNIDHRRFRDKYGDQFHYMYDSA